MGVRQLEASVANEFIYGGPLIPLASFPSSYHVKVLELRHTWFNSKFGLKRLFKAQDELSRDAPHRKGIAFVDSTVHIFPELDLAVREFPWNFEHCHVLTIRRVAQKSVKKKNSRLSNYDLERGWR
jgi:hypothetical protein